MANPNDTPQQWNTPAWNLSSIRPPNVMRPSADSMYDMAPLWDPGHFRPSQFMGGFGEGYLGGILDYAGTLGENYLAGRGYTYIPPGANLADLAFARRQEQGLLTAGAIGRDYFRQGFGRLASSALAAAGFRAGPGRQEMAASMVYQVDKFMGSMPPGTREYMERMIPGGSATQFAQYLYMGTQQWMQASGSGMGLGISRPEFGSLARSMLGYFAPGGIADTSRTRGFSLGELGQLAAMGSRAGFLRPPEAVSDTQLRSALGNTVNLGDLDELSVRDLRSTMQNQRFRKSLEGFTDLLAEVRDMMAPGATIPQMLQVASDIGGTSLGQIDPTRLRQMMGRMKETAKLIGMSFEAMGTVTGEMSRMYQQMGLPGTLGAHMGLSTAVLSRTAASLPGTPLSLRIGPGEAARTFGGQLATAAQSTGAYMSANLLSRIDMAVGQGAVRDQATVNRIRQMAVESRITPQNIGGIAGQLAAATGLSRSTFSMGLMNPMTARDILADNPAIVTNIMNRRRDEALGMAQHALMARRGNPVLAGLVAGMDDAQAASFFRSMADQTLLAGPGGPDQINARLREFLGSRMGADEASRRALEMTPMLMQWGERVAANARFPSLLHMQTVMDPRLLARSRQLSRQADRNRRMREVLGTTPTAGSAIEAFGRALLESPEENLTAVFGRYLGFTRDDDLLSQLTGPGSRIRDIHQQLQQPGLSAERRAELTHERDALITSVHALLSPGAAGGGLATQATAQRLYTQLGDADDIGLEAARAIGFGGDQTARDRFVKGLSQEETTRYQGMANQLQAMDINDRAFSMQIAELQQQLAATTDPTERANIEDRIASIQNDRRQMRDERGRVGTNLRSFYRDVARARAEGRVTKAAVRPSQLDLSLQAMARTGMASNIDQLGGSADMAEAIQNYYNASRHLLPADAVASIDRAINLRNVISRVEGGGKLSGEEIVRLLVGDASTAEGISALMEGDYLKPGDKASDAYKASYGRLEEAYKRYGKATTEQEKKDALKSVKTELATTSDMAGAERSISVSGLRRRMQAQMARARSVLEGSVPDVEEMQADGGISASGYLTGVAKQLASAVTSSLQAMLPMPVRIVENMKERIIDETGKAKDGQRKPVLPVTEQIVVNNENSQVGHNTIVGTAP